MVSAKLRSGPGNYRVTNATQRRIYVPWEVPRRGGPTRISDDTYVAFNPATGQTEKLHVHSLPNLGEPYLEAGESIVVELDPVAAATHALAGDLEIEPV